MKNKENKMDISPAALKALANDDLDNFLVAATPGGIERQEAAGQQSFVASETLPRKFNYCTQEQFEKMGIRFGDPVDDLFQRAMLPKGWKKVATDHSMWSKLIDDKGRERAAMFYKAAFYDRSAFIGITRRFSVTRDYQNKEQIVCQVKDGNDVIYSTDPIPRPAERPWHKEDEQMKIAAAWLSEHYPNHEDPTAYWD